MQVKLLRLLANLAIHPAVGPALAKEGRVADCLLALLEGHAWGEGGAEELVLNAVCTLTNLSFYQTPDNAVSHGWHLLQASCLGSLLYLFSLGHLAT